MKYLIAAGVIAFLVILYLVLYTMNKKTPVPKGCENIKDLESKCASCTNEACSFKKKEEAQDE